PALFFALSQYTGHAMFIGRYLLFATPPFFILLAWALSAFRTPLARVVILLSILGVCAAMQGLRTDFKRGPYEFRAPLAKIALLTEDVKTPVFFSSFLYESVYMDWKSGLSSTSYLFAPLSAYPVSNHVIPLPSQMTADAQQYVRDLFDSSQNY